MTKLNKAYFIIGLVCCIISLSSCVKKEVRNGNTIIRTQDRINETVGIYFGELARERAEQYLCLKPDGYNIIIIDTNKAKTKVPNYDVAVVLPWIFRREVSIDDNRDLYFDQKVTFYARSFGPNSPISHELGHLLFAKYIIGSDGWGSEEAHYGSIAPDWIDEGVAILFEADKDKEARRVQFYESIRNSHYFTLPDLLKMDHPIWAKRNEKYEDNFRDAVGVVPAGMQFDEEILFYLRSMAFLEFLTRESGNDCIAAEIGKAVAQGERFEEWLAVQDFMPDLKTVDQLEIAFFTDVESKKDNYPSSEDWFKDNMKLGLFE